jgi:uncharacterized protein YbjT (DUF2867 family)
MRVVVLGSTGLIGRGLVTALRSLNVDVVAATRKDGCDVVTGSGLSETFKGAQAVVDVTNSPSFETAAATSFFTTTSRNIIDAAKLSGVSHIVALSVVGSEHLTEMGYFTAKLLQEEAIKSSGLPFTILRATQFFEFVGAIAEANKTPQGIYKVSGSAFQPMAAKEVSETLAKIVTGTPKNGTVEVGGPERIPLYQAVETYFKVKGEKMTVERDDSAKYYGAISLKGDELCPGKGAIVVPTTLEQWLQQQK